MLQHFKRQPVPKRIKSIARLRINPFVLWALPALCSILLFSIYPMAKYIWAAVLDWRPPQPLFDAKYVGFKHFRDVLSYYKLPQLIYNSLILRIWDIALLPIPMLLALASQHCCSERLKKLLEIFSLTPVFFPSVVVVAVTQRILSTEELLNQFLLIWGKASRQSG